MAGLVQRMGVLVSDGLMRLAGELGNSKRKGEPWGGCTSPGCPNATYGMSGDADSADCQGLAEAVAMFERGHRNVTTVIGRMASTQKEWAGELAALKERLHGIEGIVRDVQNAVSQVQSYLMKRER